MLHAILIINRCLADHDADGNLSLDEFCVAMHLIDQAKSGFVLPVTLPPELVPPSQRKMRRTSEVSALPAASSISSFNTGVISNNKSMTRVCDSNFFVNEIKLDFNKLDFLMDFKKIFCSKNIYDKIMCEKHAF